MLAASYGRPVIIGEGLAMSAIDSYWKDHSAPHDTLIPRLVELFEILHQGMVLLYDDDSGPSAFIEKVALPKLHAPKGLYETAIQFDSCLIKWEQQLSERWRSEDLDDLNEPSARAATALRLR